MFCLTDSEIVNTQSISSLLSWEYQQVFTVHRLVPGKVIKLWSKYYCKVISMERDSVFYID